MIDKVYILKNGLIEQYLLGELSPNEELQVELVLNMDSDLKIELETLEANFEKMALENAIIPPKKAKVELIQKIKSNQPKIIPIQKNNFYKTYLFAVSSIAACLLIGSIFMFNQLNNSKKQLQVAEDQKELLKRDIEGLKTNLEYTSRYFEIINSPETKQYILTGNTLAPTAKIVSYVNHKNKSVIINTKQLPKLDKDHDYQMWADVNGEMINMGVIDKENQLLAMQYVDAAESLNITIEPAGGNDHPTVSRLLTNVYLN